MTMLIRPRPTMMTSRRRKAMLAVSLGAIGLSISSGCGLFRSGDDSQNTIGVTTRPVTTRESWSSAQPLPQALQPTNRPVVQGQLPLIYLVESECTIRVTSVSSGEEIIAFPAKASQIVRVEPRGVLLAEKPVIGASLAPGEYAIEIVQPNLGVVRSSQTIFRPVPAAATRPAATQPAVRTTPPAPISPAPVPAPPTPAAAPPATRPAAQAPVPTTTPTPLPGPRLLSRPELLPPPTPATNATPPPQ